MAEEDNSNANNNSVDDSALDDWVVVVEDEKKGDEEEEDEANEVQSEAGDSDENSTVNGATSESFSFSFSSSCFAFSETPGEEDAAVECIDRSGHLFSEFKKKPPTLEEALEAMGYVKKEDKKEDKKPTEKDEKLSRTLSKMFLERAMGKLEELDAPGLTAEDVAAVFCYAYE